jgi:hypothetical protein
VAVPQGPDLEAARIFAVSVPKATLFSFLSRYAERLRFPQLFLLTLGLFLLDLVIPDLLPFADELLLGLATLLLGSWKRDRESKRRPSGAPPPAADVIDVEPRRGHD